MCYNPQRGAEDVLTVAVSCNLSDGVILAVDSAVTVPGPSGIVKVYENGEKLFQIADRPVGAAIFGLGALGPRSIASYLHEFEETKAGECADDGSLAPLVESLRCFLYAKYREIVVPAVEAHQKTTFDKVLDKDKPLLGLVVGGFAKKAYLSEVWSVLLPLNSVPSSAKRARGPGEYGTNWFSLDEPIYRYIKGSTPALRKQISALCKEIKGADLTPEEEERLGTIFRKQEYSVPFGAMPLLEGIEHARFLVELVIHHHRYVAVGAPVVGGRVQIGFAKCGEQRFEILAAERREKHESREPHHSFA
jgi:hypothetical protein